MNKRRRGSLQNSGSTANTSSCLDIEEGLASHSEEEENTYAQSSISRHFVNVIQRAVRFKEGRKEGRQEAGEIERVESCSKNTISSYLGLYS